MQFAGGASAARDSIGPSLRSGWQCVTASPFLPKPFKNENPKLSDLIPAPGASMVVWPK